MTLLPIRLEVLAPSTSAGDLLRFAAGILEQPGCWMRGASLRFDRRGPIGCCALGAFHVLGRRGPYSRENQARAAAAIRALARHVGRLPTGGDEEETDAHARRIVAAWNDGATCGAHVAATMRAVAERLDSSRRRLDEAWEAERPHEDSGHQVLHMHL